MTVVATNLPQSYVITKTTPVMVAAIRDALMNDAGKVYSLDDIKRVCSKVKGKPVKWVNAFIYYASRETLDANARETFPIVAVKKNRKVVGYRYEPMSDNIKRNAKGHHVKATAIIGKWEGKLRVRAAVTAKMASEAAAANSATTEAAAD